MSLDEIAVLKILTNKLNHENFTLENYILKPLQVNGMMGEHLELSCNVLEEPTSMTQEHKFFVEKKPPQEEEISKELCDKVFGKEQATFGMFKAINLPTLNTSFPTCFYSDNHHLVLANLHIEGYKDLTTSRVATEDELLAVLKTLAGMHAAGIAYEEFETIKHPHRKPVRLNNVFPEAFVELYMVRESATMDGFHGALMKGLKTAIDVFNLPKVLKTGKLLKEEINRFWEFFDPEIGVQSSKKYRNVMCHSDLWPANIFIKYDEYGKAQHAKIIDFQIERYLPPAFDVLDYILLNTTREYRVKNLLYLKQMYYNFFCNYLEEYGISSSEIYTFMQFLDSFKEIEMFAIYLELHTIPMVYNSNHSAYDITQSEQYNSILFVDRSPFFTDFASNVYYMDRMRDCMLDMVEYFENN